MSFLSDFDYILLLSLVIFSPLLGAVYGAFWGNRQKSLQVGIFNSFLIFISFISSVILFISAANGVKIEFQLMDWMVLGDFRSHFSFGLDSISATMILIVSLVSFLVHVYSIGYMSDDKGFNRYFSYLSGFVFSMMILVMSDNFLGLFIGWEGVGLCSYLLIGFWYKRESANNASIEAFVMNRIADLGMLLGIMMIYWMFGTLKYSEVFSMLQNANFSNTSITIAGLLLFIGAMGKSAQFPLHTWLANAMEGPTPVSALIHAATMVTAGVYLIIRAHPLYDLIPQVGYFIACLGAFVAIFGASMALVNKDLKRIIAYSTLSQLGYMFVAAGLGVYWVALFHLFTHAFFKSLLFLGAGNVMHAMEDKLDITKMGGLFKPLKITAVFMTIASVALCGIYPFAGFFSKDKILEISFGSGHHILWLILLIAAVFTAFYSFRLLMLVFFAPKVHDIHHPHEAKSFMLWSMFPLVILAIIAGLFEEGFSYFISQSIPNAKDFQTPVLLLIAITTALSVISAIYAILRYRNGYKSPANEKERNFLHKLLLNQYYIPQLYKKIFIRPYARIADFLWQKIEIKIIDAIVDSIGKMLMSLSRTLQYLQTGNLTQSLRLMSFGVFIMLVFAIIGFWR
ncbi:NADH-quinone oxidoreductase subunit L [Helicobacter cappadocius]|uniref:NADH-quinone oxidoreductase subunit L n=1 Tax=Helicobacter cappadocius TaxID=3063998 RepID=A0AA90PJW7_9HELI|nr:MULTISPECIES: NADH-quinone oxidoreductase subunit L [unclassified Helicobacter]MDO7253715.1 NADH-quinone oxidoreductase subunit L [Helicobacter sp. faydin-H75]MDP2539597.1 NADH-quinone oxidoreductase subunit L [Helicobacter sp. faydin-H76]